uniref:Bulb-type lectin domain-containing protein n=1 Tax=Monopterus albus TaxID=43700 RepID=A0A3Q3Q179_MONAL
MDTARHSISTNQTLLKGEAIFSRSGNYKAVFETNGNFVLYEWKQKWASETSHLNGDCIVLEDDSTLAIYKEREIIEKIGKPHPQSTKWRVTVSDDGHLIASIVGQPGLK